MSAPCGYAFRSVLAFEQLRDRLAQLGHGEWQERDNDVYGTYIAGALWGVRMRIWDGIGCQSEYGTYDPGGYMLLDYARSALELVSDAHDRRIREELLPALEVTEWKPEDRND